MEKWVCVYLSSCFVNILYKQGGNMFDKQKPFKENEENKWFVVYSILANVWAFVFSLKGLMIYKEKYG